MVKRVFYSDFFNRIKISKLKASKQKLALQKIIKISKMNEKFTQEGALRKI